MFISSRAPERASRPRPRPRAFTLVELLVVIGIIAVLVGVLLPALAGARLRAQTAVCLSNLRQMGQAYYMYVGDNKGYLPYTVYPSWQLRPTDPAWQPSVHWYVALSPYMGQKIDWDQTQTPWRRTTDYSKVIRACPAWKVDQLGIPDTPGNDYLTGYGQNLTLFLGSGKSAVGTEKPSSTPFGDPSYWFCGIHGNGSFNYAVGAVKLSTIPKPAKTVINGDSVNWFILIQQTGFPRAWRWWQPPGSDIPVDVRNRIFFDSGAPNRHSKGRSQDAGAINLAPTYTTLSGSALAGKQGTCRANYLFLDGHAESLASDQALRAIATRNW